MQIHFQVLFYIDYILLITVKKPYWCATLHNLLWIPASLNYLYPMFVVHRVIIGKFASQSIIPETLQGK